MRLNERGVPIADVCRRHDDEEWSYFYCCWSKGVGTGSSGGRWSSGPEVVLVGLMGSDFGRLIGLVLLLK